MFGGDDRIDLGASPAARLTGHVLADGDGRILGVDSGFCDIMQTSTASLVGRTVIAITTPEDRPVTAEKLDWLRLAETCFSLRKRYLRDDGSLAWAENDVALMRDGLGPVRIIATIKMLRPPAADRLPADLLHAARLLLESRRRRDQAFNPGLFGDPAWDLLLAVYVCEAEGRMLTAEALCDASGIGAMSVVRWASLLLATGLLEPEITVAADIMRTPLRLSSEGHRRFELYLAELLDWHETSFSYRNAEPARDAYPGCSDRAQ